MGIGAVATLGTLLIVGALGWAFDLFDGSNDKDDDSHAEPPPEVDPDERLTGTPGRADMLQGEGGNDTLSGDFAEADTLNSGDGDDRLLLAPGNVGTGGDGTDSFRVSAIGGAPAATVTDFEPGEDLLRFSTSEDTSYQDNPTAFDWVITDAGAELYRFPEGDLRHGPEEDFHIVTLEVLDAPPPLEDQTHVAIDERLDEIEFNTGAAINLVQHLEGTDGDDAVELTGYNHYVLDTGAGDDTVTFDALSGDTGLGAGDDVYVSEADQIFGESPPDSIETVLAGIGNDTVTGGATAITVHGRAGDDEIDVSDSFAGTVFGGPGSDAIHGNDDSVIDPGTGEDMIFLDPTPGTGQGAEISNFDPVEDVLVVMMPPDYQEEGTLTLTQQEDGTGSAVFLDGEFVARVMPGLGDLTSVRLVEPVTMT